MYITLSSATITVTATSTLRLSTMNSAVSSTPCWIPQLNNVSSADYPFIGNSTAGSTDRSRIVIAMASVRLCLAVFGCMANIIAAVVLTNRKLWSPTSMLLLSLVIYDAIYLMLVIPMASSSISINFDYTPARLSALKTITMLSFPLRYMAQMASTYTTLTVTLERYLVILLPLKASSMWTYGKTRRAIVGVLLFSVIFNLPRCFDNILSKTQVPSSSSSLSSSSSTGLPLHVGEGGEKDPLSVGNLSSATPAFDPDRDAAPESVYMGLVAQDSTGSDVTASENVSCAFHLRSSDALSETPDASPHASRQNWNKLPSPSENSTAASSDGWSADSGEGVSKDVNYLYKVVYIFYLTVIFLYLIPYTLIPVLNLQLVMALRRRREETRRISVKNEHRLNGTGAACSPTDKEEGLTYIVFGITFCYFVCCILPAAYMLSAIASAQSNDATTNVLIFNAGETTLAINAATNFFFYCLLGRKFRRVFMRTFCPKRYLKRTKTMTLRSTASYNSV